MNDYNEIKVVGIDVDGTLTDGVYYIQEGTDDLLPRENPRITKGFYTRDFYAIEELMRVGINVVIVTQAHDGCIVDQVDRICSHSKFWQECYEEDKIVILSAKDDKKIALEKYFKRQKRVYERDLGWDSLAYMGDAENDEECLELATYAGVPADAVVFVDGGGFESECPGGKGAVYEFCMDIVNGIEGGL